MVNTTIDEVIDENDWKKDNFTLRVRGGKREDGKSTDPIGLSRSILYVLRDNPDCYVKILTVGPIALYIALQAYRLAKQEVEKTTDGVRLVCSQTEYWATVNEKRTKGICTRIYSIPIKYAK